MRVRSMWCTPRVAPWVGVAAATLLVVLGGAGVVVASEPAGVQVEQSLQQQLAVDGTTGYIIELREKADLSPAYAMSWVDRGRYVYETLRATAARSQADLVKYLTANGVKFQAFWIDNVIIVERSSINVVNEIQQRTDVARLLARRTVELEPVKVGEEPPKVAAVEDNLTYVGAPGVWALGYDGTGIVVANIDTGARTTHNALRSHYRGWDGATFNHDYNFSDPTGACGGTPCDNNGHGSHTMGTMVGDDGGANQIGMAPGAKWIACKGCASNSCADTDLVACAQWIVAPTKWNGSDANPNLRPHIVNNSWGGGSGDNWYQSYVNAWRAAGIYPSMSIGNSNTCGSAGSPGDYPNVTGVGNFDHRTGIIHPSYSSRGPGAFDIPPAEANGYPKVKPQISAPGTNVRSSVNTGDNAYDGTYTGTSMASPHVAGAVALMWSACPLLVGDYVNTLMMLENNATQVYNVACPTGQAPDGMINNTYGFGRLNALAAVNAVVAWCGPTGTLTGTVTTEAGAPLAGALVTAESVVLQGGSVHATKTAVTDATGSYTMTYVPVDDYHVTATKFGYDHDADDTPYPKVATVAEGATTVVEPIWLEAVGTYVVDGFVTAAEHVWPLWAKIDVKLGSVVVATTYTSPWNGYYEIELPNGATYEFTVHSMYAGYVDAVRSVTVASADQVQSFSLAGDAGNPAYACKLQGGINEQFEGDFPPAGWTVKNNTSSAGNIWKRNDQWGRANMTGGTGYSAAADSDMAGSGSGAFDTELLSPLIVMPATPRNLVFKHRFQYIYTTDRGYVDVSTNGGATWTNLRTFSATDSTEQTIDMSAYAGMTIVLRWRYVSGSWAYYWQIDDVRTQTIPPPPPPPIVAESFTGATFPPVGWAVYNLDGGGSTWVRNTSTYHSSPGSAQHNYASSSAGMQDGWLVTPAVTIPAAGAPLTFWEYTSFPTYYYKHSLWVCTTSCTSPPTNFTEVQAFGSPTSAWRQQTVSLNAYAGQSIYLAFRYQGQDADAWYLDDIEILSAPPPPVVVDTPTLECGPVPGTLVAGFVTDDNTTVGIVGASVERDLGGVVTTLDATGNLPAGFYYMFSPVGAGITGPSTRTFTASKTGYGSVSHSVNLVPDSVNRIDFALPAANLELADFPFVIDGRLTPNGVPAWDKTDSWDVLNSGGLAAYVKFAASVRASSYVPPMPREVLGPPSMAPEVIARQLPSLKGVTINRPPHTPKQVLAVGDVLASWPTGLSVAWGAGASGDTVWVGDPDVNRDYEFTATGTPTGREWPASFGGSWAGDMSVVDNNGMLWQVNVGGDNCIYEIDPAAGPTSNKICWGASTSERGLAYDKDTDTFFVGGWNTYAITRFDRTGTVLQTKNVGLDISGLAYNPATQHLFVMENSDSDYVTVLDVANDYAEIGSFTIAGFGNYSGAGLEFGCAGLWAMNQNDNQAYLVDAGETYPCNPNLPWFVMTPTEGPVPSHGQLTINGEFFPEGVAPAHFGLFRAVVNSSNDTPVGLPQIPVYFTKAFWDVPRGHWADEFIHALAGVRITLGCGGGNFCPDNNVPRSDMAILMVRAIHGPGFVPPPAVGIFVDVPISDTDVTADYIEQLYNDGIVAGCAVGGGGERYYCPNDLVNRAQMAIFLCAGLGIPPVAPPAHYFLDIAGYEWAEGYIEAIFNEGITAGCGSNIFCPGENITRAQLAVWLTVGLGLDTYRHPMNP